MMGKKAGRIFEQMTTVVSILFAALGVLGAYLNPKNVYFIIMSSGVILIVVAVIDKIKQIDENTGDITTLNEKLNIEKRFQKIEKEIGEHKGKLSMMVKQ